MFDGVYVLSKSSDHMISTFRHIAHIINRESGMHLALKSPSGIVVERFDVRVASSQGERSASLGGDGEMEMEVLSPERFPDSKFPQSHGSLASDSIGAQRHSDAAVSDGDGDVGILDGKGDASHMVQSMKRPNVPCYESEAIDLDSDGSTADASGPSYGAEYKGESGSPIAKRARPPVSRRVAAVDDDLCGNDGREYIYFDHPFSADVVDLLRRLDRTGCDCILWCSLLLRPDLLEVPSFLALCKRDGPKRYREVGSRLSLPIPLFCRLSACVAPVSCPGASPGSLSFACLFGLSLKFFRCGHGLGVKFESTPL